jgi:hypothetical protein
MYSGTELSIEDIVRFTKDKTMVTLSYKVRKVLYSNDYRGVFERIDDEHDGRFQFSYESMQGVIRDINEKATAGEDFVVLTCISKEQAGD